MVFRELTLDDLQDKLTIKGTLLDILAVTAERAQEICQIEEAKKAREITPPPRKRSRETTRPRISHNDGDGKRKKKRRSTSSASKQKKSNLPKKKDDNPPLPAEVENAIGGVSRNNVTAARLVIQKKLTATDVSHGHNRLAIPFNQILWEEFLTEEEKRHLRRYDEGRRKKKKFKKVKIFEPSLEMETVKICRWDMEKDAGGKTSSSYIINGKWNGIVKRNHLIRGMVIQLWCFRVDDRDLCFALVVV